MAKVGVCDLVCVVCGTDPSVISPLGGQSASAAAPAARSCIVGIPACFAELTSAGLQLLGTSFVSPFASVTVLPPPPPPVTTTMSTMISARATAPPTISWVRRLPETEPRPLKNPAAREAMPGPRGTVGAGGGARPARGAGGAGAGGGGGGQGARAPLERKRGEGKARRGDRRGAPGSRGDPPWGRAASGSERGAVRARWHPDRSAGGERHQRVRSGPPGRADSRSARPAHPGRRRRSR